MGETFPTGNDMNESWAYVRQEAIGIANYYNKWFFVGDVFKVFQNGLKRTRLYTA